MRPFFRRRVSPELDGLEFEPDERVLATAESPAGPVVATTHRLAVPGVASISWDRIERATWDRDAEHLVVVETVALGSRPRRYRIDLPHGAHLLLDVVREQVNATVVVSRYAKVTADGGVRVSGRRRPGHGELSWTATPDRGVDLDDPEVRARVDAFVAQVRAEVE